MLLLLGFFLVVMIICICIREKCLICGKRIKDGETFKNIELESGSRFDFPESRMYHIDCPD